MANEDPKNQIVPAGFFKGTDLLPTSVSYAPAHHPESGGNVEADDIVLPKLMLLQGMSPQMTDGTEGAKPGLFYNTSTQQVIVPPLRALVVHHHKSRYFKPNKKSEARKPGMELCVSADAIAGTRYGFCSKCQLAQWEDNPDPRGKGLPPLCPLSHNFALMTNDGPVVLRVRTSNTDNSRTVKALITDWKVGRFRGRELWEQPLVINVKPVPMVLEDGTKTTFFSFDLSWQKVDEIPASMQAAAQSLHRQVKEAFNAGKLEASDVGDDDERPQAKVAKPKQPEFEDTIPF